MLKDNKQDICSRELDYSMISLLSKKLKIGIVGFGKAGVIKAKHFLNQGCQVEVLTKSIEGEIPIDEYNKLNIIYDSYERNFILDKHIVIIAVDDFKVREEIKRDCDDISKIYIDAADFKEGIAVVPVQRNSNNIVVGLNTRGGNPKGAVLLAEKVSKDLSVYDEFINYTTLIRNKLKDRPEIKKQVLDFIFCEDFLFFFKKGRGREILKIFYGEV